MPDDDISELDSDVRSVSVIWSDDDEFPRVVYAGCSQYEALGLLSAGYRKLSADCDIPQDDEDDEL